MTQFIYKITALTFLMCASVALSSAASAQTLYNSSANAKKDVVSEADLRAESKRAESEKYQQESMEKLEELRVGSQQREEAFKNQVAELRQAANGEQNTSTSGNASGSTQKVIQIYRPESATDVEKPKRLWNAPR